MGVFENAPPFTDQNNWQFVTLCGSCACTDTVTVAFAAGTTGWCDNCAKVGPKFAA
jgi:hypothetical protein